MQRNSPPSYPKCLVRPTVRALETTQRQGHENFMLTLQSKSLGHICRQCQPGLILFVGTRSRMEGHFGQKFN